jgi:hypothetical protein
MGLSDHVDLTITQDTVGVARAGFGVPLILSHNASFSERLRFYTDLTGVAGDSFATSSPEYRAAQAMLSQKPRPKKIAIGRAPHKPTQVYQISVASVRNSHTYKLFVKGEGFADATVSITSDSSATDGEIATAIKDALNLVTGKNFAATGTTSPVSVTGSAAGNWFSIEVETVDDLLIAQTHAAPSGSGTSLADDLAAIQLENSGWYGLVTLYNSEGYIEAAAAWIETQKKIYAPDSNDSIIVTTAASGGTDVASDMKTSAYARSLQVSYHPSPAAMLGAAWLGRCLPLEPGSVNFKFKTLAGVPAVTLTSTQRTNLTDKNANSYETVAGVNITFDGKTPDGDFIDVTRDLDWLDDDMSKGVFGALARNDKVPYTDDGVSVIEGEVRGSLRRAVGRGILASDPAPTVTVPLVADVDTNDKAARLLPDVKFSGTLAGSINKTEITGVVSV